MISERMWMRGKSLIDVDTFRGGPLRYCIRSFNVDTFNRQILLRPMLQHSSRNHRSNFHQWPLFNRRSVFSIGYIIQTDYDRDNIHHSMKRKALLRNFRFDENMSCKGVLYYRFQQSRCSGMNIKDTSRNKSSANDQTSVLPGNVAESKANRGTDPAFASYLTGEIKPQSILNELTKLSATSILNQRRTAAAKRSRSFALDTNNDRELYRQITDFQILQKEKSHRKTAFNVNRALIGNVIICTGKLCFASCTLRCAMLLCIC